MYSCEIRRSCHLGLLFERDCSTKEKGFIEAIWKNKLLKPHMVSGPLDVTNDTWIKSQGSHCKKGIHVGVHPCCRTKMAEKSSLSLANPSHKCLSKGVLQGKEIMASNLHSAAASPVLCASSISWSRLEEGKELAQGQLQGLVKSRFGSAKLLHGWCFPWDWSFVEH